VSIARRIRWIVLFAMLVGGVGWLVISIIGLSRSANAYGNMVVKHEWSETRPSDGFRHAMQTSQDDLARHVMIAVALVAFTLVMMFINAFLRDRRTDLPR
jgi:hypothetical protein